MRMIAVVRTAGGEWDLSRDTPAGHIATDATLATTVLLLLLTEARALDEDLRPGDTRGGWWGNSYPDVPGWELGSRLHILQRGRATAETARLIEQEIRARLQPLLDDRIARALDVNLSWSGDRWTAEVGIYQDTAAVQWVKIWEETA